MCVVGASLFLFLKIQMGMRTLAKDFSPDRSTVSYGH